MTQHGRDLSADGGRGDWGKVFQPYAGMVAKKGTGLNRDARMMMAAISRANNGGHAVFTSGELAWILGKPDKDGSMRRASRATLYATIGKLKSAGALAEGNEHCLWLPWELWDRGKRGGAAYCPVHGTRAGASAVTPDWMPEPRSVALSDAGTAGVVPGDPDF